MKLNSIRIKMLLVVVVAAVLGFATTITTVTLRAGDLQKRTAFAVVEELAQRSGGDAQAYLEHPMDTARALAGALKGFRLSNQADRTVADAMLRQVLEDQPGLVGVWTAWEPNAFDGRDSEYVGRPGHDRSGRYVPYWNRGSGSIAVTPLVNYDVSGVGNFYQLAKRTGRETILDPYT